MRANWRYCSTPRLFPPTSPTKNALHHEALIGYLSDAGVPFQHDPFLVRGFDYYTKTAFEIQSPDLGAQNALGGGGRYNKLVEEIGGPPTPGIGFGLGVERALIALQALGVEMPAAAGTESLYCHSGRAPPGLSGSNCWLTCGRRAFPPKPSTAREA